MIRDALSTKTARPTTKAKTDAGHEEFVDDSLTKSVKELEFSAGDVAEYFKYFPDGTGACTGGLLGFQCTGNGNLLDPDTGVAYCNPGAGWTPGNTCVPLPGAPGPSAQADLFDTFNVKPGENLDLTKPSASNGRSYITYVAKDVDGNVRYVGRAQGKGNPLQVMGGRISRGHDIFKQNPDLTPHVIDVQQSLEASKGAEEFFVQGYLQRGADLLNDLSGSPPLGFSKSARGKKSVQMMDAFFDDLLRRG